LDRGSFPATWRGAWYARHLEAARPDLSLPVAIHAVDLAKPRLLEAVALLGVGGDSNSAESRLV
jgi:hypothetical protein